MKEFEFFNAAKLEGQKIKEGLDRRNRQPKGEMETDEDQDITQANDPKNSYITQDDLSDNSYLNYGEPIISAKEGEEIEETPDRQAGPHPIDLEIHGINNLHRGEIAAAHIIPEENIILVNQEAKKNVHETDKQYSDIASKSPLLDIKNEEEPIFSAPAEIFSEREDAMFNQKMREQKLYDSKLTKKYTGDNLKTMPDGKKERNFRGIIRYLFKSNLN